MSARELRFSGVDSEQSFRRTADLLLAVFLVVGAIWTFAWFRDLRHDDAYITFHYARNLVEGAGLVFNPGERIFGFSSPLHVLLSALLFVLFGKDLPVAAVALGTASLAAESAFVYLLLRRAAPAAALVAGACVMLGMGFVPYLALETHLFAALALGTLAADFRGRLRLAGVLLGLAFLARYDAGLLIPLLAIRHWSRERRIPAALFLPAAAVVTPWLIFSLVYYGSIVPHTLHAKLGLENPFAYLAYHLDVLFALPEVPEPAGTILAFVLLPVAVVWSRRHCQEWLFVMGYAAAHAAAYALIGPPKLQLWHMYIPIVVTRVSLLVGAIAPLARAAGARLGGRGQWAAAALGLPIVIGSALSLAQWHDNFPTEKWLGERQSRYETVARWMLDHFPGRPLLLAREVGTLAYLTRYPVVDPFGLVTETNEWPRTEAVRDLVRLVAERRPDVLLLDSREEGEAMERELGYRIVHIFPWRTPWSTVVVR